MALQTPSRKNSVFTDCKVGITSTLSRASSWPVLFNAVYFRLHQVNIG